MRVQLVSPAEHTSVVGLPLAERLATWERDDVHDVRGPHRHVVRRYEHGDITYVLKELPDRLVDREFRLLRHLADQGVPTVDVVGSVTERHGADGEGLLVTRHLDYSLTYRTLLSGRGLQIPYLGQRLLDAVAGLLVRLHLIGFFWGDCSLSNTLFRRDAGALSAYVIDVETAELHPSLTDGQRTLDVDIAMENLAGGLLDLQAAGRLTEEVDPWATAEGVEETYRHLWDELTLPEEFSLTETYKVDHRLQRLHDLGFSVEEVELVQLDAGSGIRVVPRVVEHGYHARRLASLTGLTAGENQARRMLHDITRYGAVMEERTGTHLPEALIAARWLDNVFVPTIESIRGDLLRKLEPAEVYHQLLEHRWFLSERAGHDVGMSEAVASYTAEILATAPDEQIGDDPPTIEMPAISPE